MMKKTSKRSPISLSVKKTLKKIIRAKRVKDEPFELAGKIKMFRKNHHDDIDGFKLGDGVEIRFPPHVGQEVSSLFKAGDAVSIVGHRHLTHEGDIHLHADAIESAASGQVVKVDHPSRKKHAKKHARKHLKKGHMPPHEQMLTEIRAIRTLLNKNSDSIREREGPPHERVLHELRDLRQKLEEES